MLNIRAESRQIVGIYQQDHLNESNCVMQMLYNHYHFSRISGVILELFLMT